MSKIIVDVLSCMCLVALMAGCSASSTTINTSSDTDLAALFDAITGERVTLYYRDTLTNIIYSISAEDLMVTAHTASWTQGADGMKTLSTNQIVKITCVGCNRYTVVGSVIGGLLGAGTGFLFGSYVDSPVPVTSYRSSWQWWSSQKTVQSSRETTNYTPAFTIIGGLIGAALGGSAGANAAKDETWYFETQASHVPIGE